MSREKAKKPTKDFVSRKDWKDPLKNAGPRVDPLRVSPSKFKLSKYNYSTDLPKVNNDAIVRKPYVEYKLPDIDPVTGRPRRKYQRKPPPENQPKPPPKPKPAEEVKEIKKPTEVPIATYEGYSATGTIKRTLVLQYGKSY
ncbi:protein TonB-like [Dreissena polymorpha]|uniref:Uncharacterized protein n=1 Tax=Dreissena polymorpha TaxID=45954 RepID=A0A9D4BUC1_DREPO|nr:protein TonB-like [Dreissena polymorpha]KAH3709067.1 hypothetical protein DPMN_068527 [Dreissena polymorpha]